MFDKKNLKYLFIIGVLVIAWLGFFILRLSQPSDQALIDAKIPEETKDFFRKLARSGSEVNIDFIKKLTKRDYDNEKDYGKKQDNQLLTLEDKNFIVYYHSSKKELNRAQSVLQYATKAVPFLESMFGTYYYPTLVQGRKLPIYLANSRHDYNEIGLGLGFNMKEWSAAVTCMIYDNQGKSICKGIILGEAVLEDASNTLKNVLWHEMAHFVHFTAIDLKRKTVFYNWEYEGIASYFAKEKRDISTSAIRTMQLDGQIDNYLDSYWVGDCVYKYLESKYGTNSVPLVIQQSYNEKITQSISSVTRSSFSDFETNWRFYYTQ